MSLPRFFAVFHDQCRRDLFHQIRQVLFDLRLRGKWLFEFRSRIRMHVAEEVASQFCLLNVVPLVAGDVEDLLNVARHGRGFAGFLELLPRELRSFLLVGQRLRHDAGRVPIDGAFDLSEGPAVQLGAWLQADRRGGDFQPRPLAGFGQLVDDSV